jgi:hypothetical protein
MGAAAMNQVRATGGSSRSLVLAAMIFAVAMTFIDQTIVSIAAPEVQRHLGLTRMSGSSWNFESGLRDLTVRQ